MRSGSSPNQQSPVPQNGQIVCQGPTWFHVGIPGPENGQNNDQNITHQNMIDQHYVTDQTESETEVRVVGQVLGRSGGSSFIQSSAVDLSALEEPPTTDAGPSTSGSYQDRNTNPDIKTHLYFEVPDSETE